MKQDLENLDFPDITFGDSCVGLIRAKHRALAIMGDCEAAAREATAKYNRMGSLPNMNDLEAIPQSAPVWLAVAGKALVGANEDNAAMSERYAVRALEHAGRMLKLQHGVAKGVAKGVAQGKAQSAREVAEKGAVNRRGAEIAKREKGDTTRKKISALDLEWKKAGLKFTHKDIAREVGVDRSTVTKCLNEKQKQAM